MRKWHEHLSGISSTYKMCVCTDAARPCYWNWKFPRGCKDLFCQFIPSLLLFEHWYPGLIDAGHSVSCYHQKKNNVWEICVLLAFVLHCLAHHRPPSRHCGEVPFLLSDFCLSFQEWRHAHGMRCLGIPNTAHFANVTQIEDAVSRKSRWHFFAQGLCYKNAGICWLGPGMYYPTTGD